MILGAVFGPNTFNKGNTSPIDCPFSLFPFCKSLTCFVFPQSNQSNTLLNMLKYQLHGMLDPTPLKLEHRQSIVLVQRIVVLRSCSKWVGGAVLLPYYCRGRGNILLMIITGILFSDTRHSAFWRPDATMAPLGEPINLELGPNRHQIYWNNSPITPI
jgi:hypothetical protein